MSQTILHALSYNIHHCALREYCKISEYILNKAWITCLPTCYWQRIALQISHHLNVQVSRFKWEFKRTIPFTDSLPPSSTRHFNWQIHFSIRNHHFQLLQNKFKINLPIFPPLAYGARRSTTLMPVSKISWLTLISTNSGASWWIEDLLCIISIKGYI